MSLSSEKLQLEKEIEQLVQNNPTPKFLGAKIDNNVRSTLQSWAAQRKILAEKRERLEMILEEERIQEILRELEELHPQKKYECAICLEDVTDTRRCVLVCCGQRTCRECEEENNTRDQRIKIKCCPLCRNESFGGIGKERMDNVLKFAEKGEAWAQVMMGDIYMGRDEYVDQKVNKAKAKKWYRLASEQDFADAIYQCAEIDDEEEKNPTRHRQQLKKAAEMGSSLAARTLALMIWKEGFDEVEYKYYASIFLGSISNAKKDEFLATLLGCAFSTKSVASSSEWTYKYRAKYYLEIGAKNNFECVPSEVDGLRSMICTMYANNMLQLGAREYCGYMVSTNSR